jgi:hypothetical protein
VKIPSLTPLTLPIARLLLTDCGGVCIAEDA